LNNGPVIILPKAHPANDAGKHLIRRINEISGRGIRAKAFIELTGIMPGLIQRIFA
jgi:glucan phosphorylase